MHDHEKNAEAGHEPAEHDATPAAPTLLGRLFVVPAVLVTLFMCLAIVVVLFGSTSVGQRATIDELLSTIETGSGRHTAGVMLLPRDREVWQAAQELANRLARRDQELRPEVIEPTVERLTRILIQLPPQSPNDDAVQPKRLFLILAMARLGTPAAVETVSAYLSDPDPMTRQYALRGLMEMQDVAPARAQVPRVIELLDDESREVRMIACAALGALANRGDAAVIRALREQLEPDREVQWNAALALGRLGSAAGKLTLLNMLDRGYWERSRVQYQSESESIDRPFTPEQIARHLEAAIDVAATLDDAELRASIGKLRNDPSVTVREAARRALAAERTPGAGVHGRPACDGREA